MAALWYTHLHVYFFAQNTLIKISPCPREPHLEGLLHLLPPFCLLVCSKTLSEWRNSSGSIWPHICLCLCLFLSVFDICWILSECRSSPGSPSRLGMASSANQTICHCTTVDTGHPVDSRQRGHLNDNQVLCQPFFGFCGLTFLASK